MPAPAPTRAALALALAAAAGGLLPQARADALPARPAAPGAVRVPAGTGRGAGAGAEQPVARSPSGPPLIAQGGAPGGATGEGEATGAPVAEADPLVSNGLASPACSRAAVMELSTRDRRHCETSGFVAAPAPTGNYGLDVHIDTGLLGLSSGGLLSIVQDLFVAPLWMALVWATHALVVMLEWGLSIELLPASSLASLGGSLRAMEAGVTQPWLALALAVAATRTVYRGLVRRQVAETVGEVAAMAVMMLGGLWLVVDPTATVGALGQLSARAAVGTFSVAASGTPERAAGSFATTMDLLFAATVEAPWCYLEFGQVGWCRDPRMLDRRLRDAAMQIAASEHLLVSCAREAAGEVPCVSPTSPQAQAIERDERLLREARSNGAIFLALPPNGAARNSVNEPGSLLRALCASSSLTSCRGPTAAAAEFRGAEATWSRVGGLLLIAAGLLGMLLLFGYLALRLLAAAIMSLICLLLAPAMVLAPAFGERGRAWFMRWASQLLAAVVAKLLFAFLLGVMLAVLELLAGMTALGWWTQWLLMSVLWWGAFLRRHHAIEMSGGRLGGEPPPRRGQVAYRLRYAVDTARRRRQRRSADSSDAPPPAPARRNRDAGDEGRAPRRGAAQRSTEDSGSVRSDDHGGTATTASEIDSRLREPTHWAQSAAESSEAPLGRAVVPGSEMLARPAELDSRAPPAREQAAKTHSSGAPAGERGPASEQGAARPFSAGERAFAPRPADRHPGGGAGAHVADVAHASARGPARGDSAAASQAAEHRAADRGARAAADAERQADARERLDRELDAQRRPAARSEREDGEGTRAGAGEEWSLMWDIREVEAGRKRQLGRDNE